MVRRLLVLVPMLARSRALRVPRCLAAALVLAWGGGCDPEEDEALDGSGPARDGAVAAVRDAVGGRVASAAELEGGDPEAGSRTGEAEAMRSTDLETTDPAAPAPIVLRRPWPPTTLPLGLLATMGAREPDRSRATIRDEHSGVIASYRPGDRIRDGVEVLSIEDGLVELSNEGEVEYLSISEIPVELSAGDVFYPDLVDELRLSGSMDDGTLMPPGPEYTLKAEAYSWATPRTVALLREAIRAYARGRSVPKVHLGDISRRGGGPFPPHLSHQEGRDVDIAYVLHDRRTRFAVATAGTLDRKRTWALLRAVLDTRAVAFVFIDYEVQRMLYEHALTDGMTPEQLDPLFQYPYGRRAARGIIRHWKGHRDHFHVRFSG